MDNLVALYTTTDGRISRKQWWIGVVGIIIVSIVLAIILGLIGLGTSGWGQLIAFVILACAVVRASPRNRPSASASP